MAHNTQHPAARPEDGEAIFPIRTVSELTGVNPVTLRAWERRYGLIRPQRTPKGHRLYSRADIERIRRIVSLLDEGIAVGRVREVLDRRPALPETGVEGQNSWVPYRGRMLEAVARFDERRLEAVYNEALSLYPLDLVTRQLVAPTLETLREHRRARLVGEAEHRFFVSYLRNKLGARFQHLAAQAQGPKLLFAGLPGESGEIEPLLLALEALGRGHRALLIGADVPLEALAAAAQAGEVDGIVLYGGPTVSIEAVHTQLRSLVHHVAVPVLVAGDVTSRQAESIERAGATALPPEPAEAVARMQAALHRRR